MVETTLRGRLFAMLVSMLPARAKRLIFVASFTTEVAPSNVNRAGGQLDEETLHSLNKLMQVCAREEAMVIPSYLHQVIWNGREVPNLVELQEDEATTKETFIEKVKRQIPSWLSYDKIDADIETLVENRQIVFRSNTHLAH